jgi:hypothetical protein
MSIILVRHGETALNAARVMQPADTPLSDLGKAQVLAVARRLAHAGAGPWTGRHPPLVGGSERGGPDEGAAAWFMHPRTPLCTVR